MVKRYELLRLSRSDLFDSHLLRRHLKSSDENCDTEGAECKDSENNMTPEVIAVMKMTMLKAGLSMAFMSSLVNIGSLTLQTAINRLGQDIIVAHTAARKISEIFMVMFTVFGQTMATFCGQNIGAGEVDRVKKGIKTGNILYLHMVYDGNYRKLHYRPVAGEACNRH